MAALSAASERMPDSKIQHKLVRFLVAGVYIRLKMVCAALREQSEGKQFEETWLLLEFCDKGSLQDVMDRGAFRSVRIGIEGSEVSCRSFHSLPPCRGCTLSKSRLEPLFRCEPCSTRIPYPIQRKLESLRSHYCT